MVAVVFEGRPKEDLEDNGNEREWEFVWRGHMMNTKRDGKSIGTGSNRMIRRNVRPVFEVLWKDLKAPPWQEVVYVNGAMPWLWRLEVRCLN